VSDATPDYLAAARSAFSVDALEQVRRKAEQNGHLTAELEAQLAPIREALAAELHDGVR
jgi:hypothetical protein